MDLAQHGHNNLWLPKAYEDLPISQHTRQDPHPFCMPTHIKAYSLPEAWLEGVRIQSISGYRCS
jgi:hypothetical protein